MDESPLNIPDKTAVRYSHTWPCRAMPVTSPALNGATRDDPGFTLIELLVVLAILAILVTIAIPAYNNYRDLARTSRAMSEIRTLEGAIAGYYADRGAQPPDLTAAGYGALRDPWGNLYQYAAPGTRTFTGTPINPASYDLWSNGVNGQYDPSILTDKSKDDIIRGLDGGFTGLADNYPFY